MDQDDSSLLLVGGLSSSTSTSTSTVAVANLYDDDPPSPRWGDYFNQFEYHFEVHRLFDWSSVSALSTGSSYLKDQSLATHSEIHPLTSIQNARLAKRLPLEDKFTSDEEESKAPSAPKSSRSVPKRSDDATLEPTIAYPSKSTTDVVSHQTFSKRQEQVLRAMLETLPPAVPQKGLKKERSSSFKRKGSNKKREELPDPSTAIEVVSKNSKQKQQSQKKDPQQSSEETQPQRWHSKRSTKAVRQVDGETNRNKNGNEDLHSGSVTVDTESPHRHSYSHSSHSNGGEEEVRIAHHLPKLHANHHQNNKTKIKGETRQGKNPPAPHCRDLLVSSPPRQMRSKMIFRSFSVGNMDDTADPPLLPPASHPPSTKSSSILSFTEVESKSSEESTSKDNDREVLDDDEKDEKEEEDTNNNNRNNSEEVEEEKGVAKPMSVRQQLLAADLPREFARPQMGKAHRRSLGDMTTTPSSDTMTSPQRRRGKKPVPKHIQLSPSSTHTPRSPTIRRDRDPKQQHADTRPRSTTCAQPSDRSCLRSQSTSKHTRVRSSSRSNPQEIEVMESSGKDDRTAAMAQSSSRRSSSSHSSLTRHLNGTDALPIGHQPPPLPALPGSIRRGTTERSSGGLDSPSSPPHHYLKSPSSIRRGKKPGTKHIPLSPSNTPTPPSPPTCGDHHHEPKKNKDTRHRSTSCDQVVDRSRPR